jgi:hypothetical protein
MDTPRRAVRHPYLHSERPDRKHHRASHRRKAAGNAASGPPPTARRTTVDAPKRWTERTAVVESFVEKADRDCGARRCRAAGRHVRRCRRDAGRGGDRRAGYATVFALPGRAAEMMRTSRRVGASVGANTTRITTRRAAMASSRAATTVTPAAGESIALSAWTIGASSPTPGDARSGCGGLGVAPACMSGGVDSDRRRGRKDGGGHRHGRRRNSASRCPLL